MTASTKLKHQREPDEWAMRCKYTVGVAIYGLETLDPHVLQWTAMRILFKLKDLVISSAGIHNRKVQTWTLHSEGQERLLYSDLKECEPK